MRCLVEHCSFLIKSKREMIFSARAATGSMEINYKHRNHKIHIAALLGSRVKSIQYGIISEKKGLAMN